MKLTTLLSVAAASLLVTGATPVLAQSPNSSQLLLSVDFMPRPVAQVEIGDFHFVPGQPAPLHYHAAPVIGYVSKGTIFYQVDGQAPQILKAGDAFFEPVGPKIIRFDNASSTEEAIFTDFNLEDANQPFIVFPTPPTEKIDRRAFPTVPIGAARITHAEAAAQPIDKRPTTLATANTVLGYVARGPVVLTVGTAAPLVIEANRTFSAPAGSVATLASSGDSARVIIFTMR